MRKQINMSTTHSRMVNLIARGPRVRCSRTGTYYDFVDTNPDSKGGRIAKAHDVFIHDQTTTQSKYKEGPGWQRGIKK